jgi:hypothetical protein
MKRVLLVFFLLCLVGCRDSGTNNGYEAGYKLTCGFSWSPEHKFVTDQEFAYNFLVGAKTCAREHPELARKVLGIARYVRTAPASKADQPEEPVAAELQKPQDSSTPTPPAEGPAVSPTGTTATPVTSGVSEKAKAPARPKPPARPKAAAQAERKASAEAKPPTKTQTPPAKKVRVDAAKAPPAEKKRSAPRAPDPSPAEIVKPRPPARSRETKSSYESFMGE